MRRIAILFAVVVCGLLSGCVKFSMVGSRYKEVFIGTADYNPFNGTSYIQVDSRVSKVRCEGNSYGTHAPLFSLNGVGHGGKAELTCDDGRIIEAQWESMSWSTGYVIGQDQHGDRYTFVYGMNEIEATEFMKKKLPALLRRSD